MAPALSLTLHTPNALPIKAFVPFNKSDSRNGVEKAADGATIVIHNLNSSLEDQQAVDAAVQKAINSAAATNATRLEMRSPLKGRVFDDDDDEEEEEEEKEEEEEEKEEEEEEKVEEEEEKENEEEEKEKEEEEKEEKEKEEEDEGFQSDRDGLMVAPPGVDLNRLIKISLSSLKSQPSSSLSSLGFDRRDFLKNWDYVGKWVGRQEDMMPETRESIIRPVMLMLRKRLIGSIALGTTAAILAPVLAIKLTKDDKIEASKEPKQGLVVTHPDGKKQEVLLSKKKQQAFFIRAFDA